MPWSRRSAVPGDIGYSGDVGDVGLRRSRRGNTLVESRGRKVRDDSVPPVVFAREVETLSAEVHHVRVTLKEAIHEGGASRIGDMDASFRSRV